MLPSAMDQLALCPPEILPNIFKYLPLEDRKRVRSTCRLWNDACNRRKIVRGEKFVFRTGTNYDDIQPIEACILHSKATRSSFEFQSVPLLRLQSIVWSRCGARIQTLLLNDCQLNDETVVNIVIHCYNLTHFSVQWTGFCMCEKRENYKRVSLFSEAAIDELLELKIVRDKLVSLEVFEDIFIPNKMCRKIFQIFPSIRTFGLKRWLFPTHPDGDEEWILPASIENIYTSSMLITESSIMPTAKFKRLRTAVNFFEDRDLTLFMNFLSYQTQLEKLQLSTKGLTMFEEKTLLFHVLNHSPQLKDLKFHSRNNKDGGNFFFTVSEFGEFLSKTNQLESLVLEFRQEFNLIHSHSDELQLLPSTTYTRLKTLHLGNRVDRVVVCEILNRCPTSLRYLYLKPVDDEIMQKIFKAHTELRTLSISAGRCTSASFIEAQNGDCSHEHSELHSPAKLRNLEHLEMTSIALEVFDSFLIAFIFPNLKYFRFNFEFMRGLAYEENVNRKLRQKKLMRKLLDILPSNSPNLEIFRFYPVGLGAIEFVNCCKKLKNLRFIFIDGRMFKTDFFRKFLYLNSQENFGSNLKDVEKLFEECPSLHWIADIKRHNAYGYDRFSNKLKQYTHFTASSHEQNFCV